MGKLIQVKICLIPDANLRFLRGALERLVAACPREVRPADSQHSLADGLRIARQTIDDIVAGNPEADCHYRHRANRSCLELVREYLEWIRDSLEEVEKTDWLYRDAGHLLGFDLDTCIEHVSPSALDKWEVRDG